MEPVTGLEPHHDGSPLYVSAEAPSPGDRIQIRMRMARADGPVASVHLRSTPDREPRFLELTRLGSTPGWDWWGGEVQVVGYELGYRFLIRYADGRRAWLNQAGVSRLDPRDADDFRVIAYPAPPAWAKATVMYQIFPDRFARSSAASGRTVPDWADAAHWDDEVVFEGPGTIRQFYGGDLDGIREHLDHLDRLGVTMIYLTPIFPARSNHRYDSETFGAVDPLLGGDAALIALVAEAHRRGMRVIGDLTTNHSGDGHEWFVAARGAPDAPESSFYYWLDAGNERYVSWYDVASLPKLNWTSEELRARFIQGPDSVVARWLRPPYDLDGWRVDVANMTGRHVTDDLNAQVRQIIRTTMIDVNPDTLLICESTNDATVDLQGDGWHGAMTYAPFTRPLWAWLTSPTAEGWWFGEPPAPRNRWTAEDFYLSHRTFVDGIPWRVRLVNLNALDTHDLPRFLTTARPDVLPVGLGLSMVMPGIPMVFAGDEFALTGTSGEHSRTPIPWGWVDEVDETIELYAALIRLRTAHPALNDGGMRWLHVGAQAIVFVRESASESVLVVAASGAFELKLPPGAIQGIPTGLYGTARLAESDGMLTVAGDGPCFAAWSLPGVEVP